MRKKISQELKTRAIELRKSGKSYTEIKKLLGLSSKGTLSYWFRNIELSDSAKKRLIDKIEMATKRGLLSFNTRRTKRIEIENKKIREAAKKEIKKLSRKELLLAGAALYWGEGFKSEKNKNSLKISFVNSDPLMIKLFLRFLREFLLVDDQKIKAHIRIHSNIDKNNVVKFWQNITKLPFERFVVAGYLSGASKLKRPCNSLKYGTIDIRVNGRKLFYKMKGYIDGLSAQC